MDEHQYTPPTLAPDANGIFEVVEHMPEFPDGGMSALMEYLKKNIKYPEAAMKKGTQGRVTVQFVVEKDGSIANAKVLRGVDPELDKEAVRSQCHAQMETRYTKRRSRTSKIYSSRDVPSDRRQYTS
jgi:TonB family protein